MNTDDREWPVSTTGGKKIRGDEAASILGVSKTHLYTFIKRGDLMRAEPRKKLFAHQALVFFLQDIVNLAVESGTITEEQAKQLMDPTNAVARSVAA